MSRVQIVRAKPSDAHAVLCVYAPYIMLTAATFETDVPHWDDFGKRIEEISGEFPYLLLFADDELVGYAYAHRQAERAAYAWNAELSIYLRMDRRDRGLGGLLYQLLIDLLKMQGYVNVYGVITGGNVGSVRMHEKLGFSEIGRHERTGYKFGEWYDTIWMHKRIGGDGEPEEIVRFDALDCSAVDARIAQACAQIEEKLEKAPPQDTLQDVMAMLDEIE